ncbi:hypothetical protein Leryth_003099 [Lithospermum erythrorhizon]|nr:hypothetical protein Leryth_003099 [Lithospermum erythrorhizon]
MGCGQSKIENEEAVTRCKERKHFMKEAVGKRNAFAAAHSAYSMSLKNSGAALSDFAHGEVQYPSSTTAAVLTGAGVTQPSYESFPPPPPLPPFTGSPLQRAATMPEMVFPEAEVGRVDGIIEEEDEDEVESVHELKHRSSKSSGGGISGLRREVVDEDVAPPPPSPPPLRRSIENEKPPPPLPTENQTWDYFFPSIENVTGPSLNAEVEENRVSREEIEKRFREERGEMEGGDGSGGGRKSAAKVEEMEVVEKPVELPPKPPQEVAQPKAVKKAKVVVPEGKRKGGSSVNLFQVFTELDDCFLKASESAHEVSKMLEATRLHYHSNFADNRGHIDHSARVMRVITWNRSFRGLANTDDIKDDFDSEEHETHATVLDKLLAWEKKLYDEVKAGEQMKLDYQKKVDSLNKLKKRGSNTESLEKMKAVVSHLHTRYIVDMQSMDSTVSEINRLRDEQLYPKLVALVDGMATMWEQMSVHHQSQFKIVDVLRSLDISQCSKETSDQHHGRTYQLHEVLKEWHSQFDKLIIFQKQYITSLSSWLKLNLIPIDTNLREKVSSPQRPQNPPIQALLHSWHDYLEKLPDELARTAIYNFSAVIETIMQYQSEEIKLRDKCEETRKELSRKTRQFEDWYHKYMNKKMPADEMEPDRAEDKDQIIDRQLQLEAVKKRLEDEEEEYKKQCVQVREKSLSSLKNRLPEVFQAMSNFSLASSDMYSNLRSIARTRPADGHS